MSPTDKNGWAPLHSAANEGRLDICEILLEHGAFAPARTMEGTSALHYLARVNIGLRRDAFRRVVDRMLQGGAELNGTGNVLFRLLLRWSHLSAILSKDRTGTD